MGRFTRITQGRRRLEQGQTPTVEHTIGHFDGTPRPGSTIGARFTNSQTFDARDQQRKEEAIENVLRTRLRKEKTTSLNGRER